MHGAMVHALLTNVDDLGEGSCELGPNGVIDFLREIAEGEIHIALDDHLTADELTVADGKIHLLGHQAAGAGLAAGEAELLVDAKGLFAGGVCQHQFGAFVTGVQALTSLCRQAAVNGQALQFIAAQLPRQLKGYRNLPGIQHPGLAIDDAQLYLGHGVRVDVRHLILQGEAFCQPDKGHLLPVLGNVQQRGGGLAGDDDAAGSHILALEHEVGLDGGDAANVVVGIRDHTLGALLDALCLMIDFPVNVDGFILKAYFHTSYAPCCTVCTTYERLCRIITARPASSAVLKEILAA